MRCTAWSEQGAMTSPDNRSHRERLLRSWFRRPKILCAASIVPPPGLSSRLASIWDSWRGCSSTTRRGESAILPGISPPYRVPLTQGGPHTERAMLVIRDLAHLCWSQQGWASGRARGLPGEVLPAPMSKQEDIVFGSFRLDRQGRTLSRNGVPLLLHGRAFGVLVVLATAAGRLVGKAELLDQVWSTVTVDENNLHKQISTLRKTSWRRRHRDRSGARLSARAAVAKRQHLVGRQWTFRQGVHRSAAVRQHERRSRAGVFRGRHRGGHHHRIVPDRLAARHRPHFRLHLQGVRRRCPAGGSRAWRSLPPPSAPRPPRAARAGRGPTPPHGWR